MDCKDSLPYRKDAFRVKHDTEKREENRQTQSGPNRKKSFVMRRCKKTINDVDEVTLDGRLFHTRREAATGNALLPMVEWRIDVDADLNRRRESMSATLWRSSARYGGAVERNADNGT